jgi:2-polyprenyl-6-methoxyphenol hydroxylase-like FAD-dependent oxidoreductase
MAEWSFFSSGTALMSERFDCAVLIIGGGPCGLMLAIELGRRGIATILLDEKDSPARFPQANATQARTMEHFRRLGFAERVRAQGLPADYPTDIAYFTRFTGYELARFQLPTARQARELVKTLGGSWSAAELPHRCSQMYVEGILRQEAEALASVSVRSGWRATGLQQDRDGVTVIAERSDGSKQRHFRALYAVGADGARSLTRKALGYAYQGEGTAVRDFMGGRMSALYFRSAELYDLLPHPRAWMYWTVNRDRRSFLAAINGRDEFTFHTQLHAHEESGISDEDAVRMFHAALGASLDVELLSRSAWSAGYTLVAEKFRRGRVFIAGDAAHLFTPTGGLGYNTAVEDAVNLGWKLAAVINGWGAPALLDSYDIERRHIARRNTAYARGFADSVGLFVPPEELEAQNPTGDAARKAAGEYLNTHARAEFNIPGVTFGGRYDASPITVGDGSTPPPDSANQYVPTASPGGRAPHLWIDQDTSLFDRFGFEFTLLRLGGAAGAAEPFPAAAASLGMPLTVLDAVFPEARALYEADLALIRPDQMVAWRGNDAVEATAVLRQAVGHVAHS